jgi:hypothetical protein
MATLITKSIASRVPIEMYLDVLNEAQAQGFTISDYLMSIINNRHIIIGLNKKLKDAESRFDISERTRSENDSRIVELETTIKNNEQRRKYALSKLTNYLEQSRGVKPEVIAEIWNTWY